MSQLAQRLRKVCSELGLNADFGFELVLKDGTKVHTIARVRDLGAPNGMLLLTSYQAVRNCSQQLLDAGYGYSVLDEPRPDEEFDLNSFQNMFNDWGWSGDLESQPGWML